MLYQTPEASRVYAYNQPACILPASFFEGRFTPDFHPESLDYEQWWDEQINRCIAGWSDGGYRIPGNFYYHLNFKKINLINPATNRTELNYPLFSFEDQELFTDCEQARQQGKGLMLITGRGFGKSFDAATIAEHEYTFFPSSEIIISASTSGYADKLWEKIKMGLNSQPDDLRHNYLFEDKDYIQSGEKVTENGKQRVQGYMSQMRKIVYDKEPGKTRGSRPAIHIFEEIGSWTGAAKLKQCYKMTEASWWRGKRFTCFPLMIGTGGEMETGGSEDAKDMAYNPDSYNLLSFIYKDQKVIKFYPAYRKFEGFYEESGVSDEKGAKEFLDARRESKKGDPDMARQESMEFPFELEEAFQTKGDNIFPIAILENRFADLHRNTELLNTVKKGHLHFLKDGKRVVGVDWEENPNGVFEVAEFPIWLRKDWVGEKPKDLYISGIDSFDSVLEKTTAKVRAKQEKKSKGSHFVFKRGGWKAEETGRLFVAKLTQRTEDSTEFYWNTIKLNLFYGSCKALIEYTMKGIFHHYISNGFEYLLYKRPRLDSTVVKESISTNTYGIAMPIEVKLDIIKNFARHIRETNAEDMYFVSQIKQCIDFRFGSSAFDEVMASAITLFADKDMVKIGVRQVQKENASFPVFRRDTYGNLVFN